MKNNKRKRLGRVRERLFDNLENSGPDEAVLKLMNSRRINLSKKRHVSFYLYFPTEEKAKIAEQELINSGYFVECSEPIEERSDWLCLADKFIVPDSKILTAIRKELNSLARKLNGKYDGWETGFDANETG